MGELSRKEEALVMPIVAEIAREPGVPARDLGVLIHRNMSVTLRVVQKLVDVGILERRQIQRVRSDRRERGYSGLFLAEGRKTDAAVQVEAVTPQGRPDGVTEKSEAATVPQASGIGSTPPPAPVAPLMGASMTRRMGKPAIGPAMETLRTSTVTMATRELDPARMQLREIGERLRWGRLPLTQGETRGTAFTPGRAIHAGEESWRIALEELPDQDVDVALGAGWRLLALLAPQ